MKELTLHEVQEVSGALDYGFWSGVGGVLGSRFGKWGGLGGYVVGGAIDTYIAPPIYEITSKLMEYDRQIWLSGHDIEVPGTAGLFLRY